MAEIRDNKSVASISRWMSERAREEIGADQTLLSAASVEALLSEMDRAVIPLGRREKIGAAWAHSVLSGLSTAAVEFRRKLEEGGSDPISSLSLVGNGLGRVVSPHADELMPVKERNAHFTKLKKAAEKLAALLDGLVLDQPPYFFFSKDEIASVASAVCAEVKRVNTAPKTLEQLLATAAVRGLQRGLRGDSPVLDDEERLTSTLDIQKLDTKSIAAPLIAGGSQPKLSELLRRLAKSADDGDQCSEFGAYPRSLRALRKAYANHLRSVACQVPGFGGVTTPVILLAVEALFGEVVDQADLFG